MKLVQLGATKFPVKLQCCNWIVNYRFDKLSLFRLFHLCNFLGAPRSRWRPKDSRPFVRPYVRACVTRLLENGSLFFSETLQLVRACKREKNVPSAFLKKIPFCPFWPKTVQNWPFWPKMPKIGGFSLFGLSTKSLET